jgi:hypothetical protein
LPNDVGCDFSRQRERKSHKGGIVSRGSSVSIDRPKAVGLVSL